MYSETNSSLRRIFSLSLIFTLLIAVEAAGAQRTRVALGPAWEFRQAGTGGNSAAWRPAGVPGDIHLDLMRNGVIADPYFRDNEAKLQWISDATWEYRTTLTITNSQLEHKHLELVFEGIDTVATVRVNDKAVLQANNMFREWRSDVRPYLHAGTNVVLITFPPPAVAAAEAASSDPWRSKTHTAEKAYVRKAAYEYGWDWGPTFVTSGIWLPAWLELWDDARIGYVYIHQFEVSESVAHLQDEVEIDSSAAAEAEIELQYECGQTHGGALQKVMLLPGSNRISIPLDIRSPQRWFPVGYGSHPMYTFTTTIRIGNHIEDQTHTRSGLRSVVLRRDRDAWGRSFEFRVNGIPVFAKGASVIPFRQFSEPRNRRTHSACTAERGRRQHEHDSPVGRRLLRIGRVL